MHGSVTVCPVSGMTAIWKSLRNRCVKCAIWFVIFNSLNHCRINISKYRAEINSVLKFVVSCLLCGSQDWAMRQDTKHSRPMMAKIKATVSSFSFFIARKMKMCVYCTHIYATPVCSCSIACNNYNHITSTHSFYCVTCQMRKIGRHVVFLTDVMIPRSKKSANDRDSTRNISERLFPFLFTQIVISVHHISNWRRKPIIIRRILVIIIIFIVVSWSFHRLRSAWHAPLCSLLLE